jgi:hypothetical protein
VVLDLGFLQTLPEGIGLRLLSLKRLMYFRLLLLRSLYLTFLLSDLGFLMINMLLGRCFLSTYFFELLLQLKGRGLLHKKLLLSFSERLNCQGLDVFVIWLKVADVVDAKGSFVRQGLRCYWPISFIELSILIEDCLLFYNV